MISYRYKLYNAPRNRHLLGLLDGFGRLYNQCIGTHKRYYKWYGKYLSAVDLQNHIAKLKKRPYYSWIKELPSQAVQDVVQRIDKAYRLFFSNKKKRIKSAPPTFKSSYKYKSFTLKQAGYRLLEDNKIRIGKRVYKYFKSREIEGKIKIVTVKRDNVGNLWLIIVTDHQRSEYKPLTGKNVGFDFGMKHMLVGSDGTTIDSPLFLKSQYQEQKKLSRCLSRKKLGSNNRKKAKLKLARFHQRVQNQRNDHQWKLARTLLSTYDLIKLEDLSLKGMSKHFGKKIGDYAFYSFIQKLKYLATVFGKRIEQVPRFFPSSKTCSNCGYIKQDLKLKDRSWVCPSCGIEHDRDFNASVNILNYREGTSSLRLDGVIPSLEGFRCLSLESPRL